MTRLVDKHELSAEMKSKAKSLLEVIKILEGRNPNEPGLTRMREVHDEYLKQAKRLENLPDDFRISM